MFGAYSAVSDCCRKVSASNILAIIYIIPKTVME